MDESTFAPSLYFFRTLLLFCPFSSSAPPFTAAPRTVVSGSAPPDVSDVASLAVPIESADSFDLSEGDMAVCDVDGVSSPALDTVDGAESINDADVEGARMRRC